MTGSELEQAPGQELEALSAEEQALVESIKGNIDSDSMVLPLIKLSHPLSNQVKDGLVEEGNYFNVLTGEDLGSEVPFVVCGIYKGRFFHDEETDRDYSATGPVAPDSWPEAYRGKAFADIPEAEERWKEDSNNNVHPFGHGPPIATTHNFVGFIPGDESGLPVRVSLMRSSTPAAKKIKTMVATQRAPWDYIFTLGVREDIKGTKKFLVTTVQRGGTTDPAIKQQAVKIASQYQRASQTGAIEEAGAADAGDGKVRSKPKDTGGLGVS